MASRSDDRTPAGGEAGAAVRLDVWLDVSCLFKTRSEAKRACEGGKVDVNGQPGKPHRLVRTGDELRISRPLGRRQVVVVRAVAEQSMPKSEARLLYDDRTPTPTAEEIETRRAEAQHLGDAPGLGHAAAGRERFLGVEDLADRADARLAQMWRPNPSRKRAPRSRSSGVHLQPGVDEGPISQPQTVPWW
jgi:ribosomal 50S subunit-recycling heat shock protein